MVEKSLFKTQSAKEEILALYQQKLKEVGVEYTTVNINTKYGRTHALLVGEETKPPLVLVHGSNGSAPIALETYKDLLGEFRVIAIDVLAQPNQSEGRVLSMKDDSYGKWMLEVLDYLELERVRMAGFSFGGLVILKTLEYAENRVEEVFLTAPAYIVNGNPLKALFKVFIPMKRFMKTENPKYVEKFLAEVFTKRDAYAVDFLTAVFKGFEMDFTPVPIIDKKRASGISTPIHLFAAKSDLMFPGEKMLKRAKEIFPSLKTAELINASKHVQTPEQNKVISKTILEHVKQNR